MVNNNLIQNLMKFKNSFRGNPKDQVQHMLNSGQITQQQYDNAVKQADEIARMFGIKK